MRKKKPIQIVDLFAGPGGLGEGFSSMGDRFQILVSAEMEKSAHKTLTLRAYYRILKRVNPELLVDYYGYCNGETEFPYSSGTKNYWREAENEARQITLGSIEGNKELDELMQAGLDRSSDWVLIGGPPCQAYSLVGRARNSGTAGYEAEKDGRHFLYKEYLRIIAEYRPTVFVMENVKGILSSKVSGKRVFHDILNDLSSPQRAVNSAEPEGNYVICSLITGDAFHYGDSPEKFDIRKFIIRAEEHGIPQARHRVILLGIKESVYKKFNPLLRDKMVPLSDAISALPPLRSKLSKQSDGQDEWYGVLHLHIKDLLSSIKSGPDKLRSLNGLLESIKSNLKEDLALGALRYPKKASTSSAGRALDSWYQDEQLEVWLNHESRGHMASDLMRYLFASSFASHFKKSPKGADDFALPELRPNHKNWESGKFADRFRVQLEHKPSTTITSHISKDGHYFIHPDPSQCRSLTVREAARLQTFPDNYFFQGNRTEQYHQVGNAVPPLLARKIAKIVAVIIK